MASLAVAGSAFVSGNRTTQEVTDTVLENYLNSTGNAFADYVKMAYGQIRLNTEGVLTDEQGTPLTDRYEQIDRFHNSTNVQATVFVRTEGDFQRVITSIMDQQGQRAVGTMLGSDGEVYHSMIAGQEFLGEATILGIPYVTRYTPMEDQQGEIIGILFTGIPVQQIETILDDGQARNLRAITLLVVVIILVASAAGYWIGAGISNPIIELQRIIDRLANYDLRFDETSKAVSYSKRQDEIGAITRSLATPSEASV